MKALAIVALVASLAFADSRRGPGSVTKIVIDYRWTGLASHDQAHYELAWNGSAYTVGSRTVRDDLFMRKLFELTQGGRDATRAMQCTSHTDDYPVFTITLVGSSTTTISSSSNCAGHVPWNIETNGKRTVQFSYGVWSALQKILEEVDSAKWGRGHDGEGKGSVMLDELPGAEAARCGKSMEADLDVAHALGEHVRVDKLRLWCNLDESSDCSTAHAGADFRWKGVDANAELSCTDGKVTATDKVADARTFLDSKPVRALVKLAKTAPRMTTSRGWKLDGGSGMPVLEVRPGTSVIVATGVTPAFWKELGLPAKQLPADRSATLGYDGKLVAP